MRHAGSPSSAWQRITSAHRTSALSSDIRTISVRRSSAARSFNSGDHSVSFWMERSTSATAHTTIIHSSHRSVCSGASDSCHRIRELREIAEFECRVTARQRRLAVPIDPRVRDAELIRRNDVVKIALRRVQPARIANPFPRLHKMSMRRFVGAHLLRCDDEIEVDGEVLARLGEEVVIDIGEDAEADAGAAESLEGGVRVRKRLPRRQALGQSNRGSDAGSGLPQYIAIWPIVSLDLRLDFPVRSERHGAVEVHALERGPNAALPVDQRAVAVEGDHFVANHDAICYSDPCTSPPLGTFGPPNGF